MSKSAAQLFVIEAASAGLMSAREPRLIAGHVFIDGQFLFRGNEEQVATLTRIFSFYGVVPAGTDGKPAGEPQADLESAKPGPAEGSSSGTGTTDEAGDLNEDGTVKEPVLSDDAALAAALGELSLGEAISKLDPDNEDHWTSNNLPSLEALAALVGKKVSRDEVTALADGYTRVRARAARS